MSPGIGGWENVPGGILCQGQTRGDDCEAEPRGSGEAVWRSPEYSSMPAARTADIRAESPRSAAPPFRTNNGQMALEAKRSPLVITERTEHLLPLAERFKKNRPGGPGFKFVRKELPQPRY